MATISDRDRLLSHGDPVTDLSLTLEADSNILHSTEALLVGNSVKFVTLSVNKSFSRRWQLERENILAFFAAIGKLPELESLRILAVSFGVAVELPATTLVETLKNSKKLVRLRVHGMKIRLNTIQDRHDLATTFRNHPCLSEVTFIRSLFEGTAETEDGEEENQVFPELFAVMATLPQLETLGIQYRRPAEHDNTPRPIRSKRPSNFLADFSQVPKLAQLELLNCEITDEHLQGLADSFPSFGNLQELSLSCHNFGLKTCQAIAQILATQSPLQNIFLEPKTGCPIADASSTDLIADALANNPDSMLQVFVLEGPLVTSMKAFVKMLRVHYRLKVLTINAVMPSVWDQLEISYLLKLNEIGRYALFHETPSPRRPWVEAIIKAQTDIHCLFYLLSANPSLCQPDIKE